MNLDPLLLVLVGEPWALPDETGLRSCYLNKNNKTSFLPFDQDHEMDGQDKTCGLILWPILESWKGESDVIVQIGELGMSLWT